MLEYQIPTQTQVRSRRKKDGEGTSHFVHHIIADTINLKLFITTSEHVFAQVREENHVRPGTVRGLVGQSPGCADIIKCMKA
jgi:hypothetical protein